MSDFSHYLKACAIDLPDIEAAVGDPYAYAVDIIASALDWGLAHDGVFEQSEYSDLLLLARMFSRLTGARVEALHDMGLGS